MTVSVVALFALVGGGAALLYGAFLFGRWVERVMR